MAQYLSYDGLKNYDEKIKAWVRTNAVEQFSTLPAAEAKLAGNIVEYIGATNTPYTQGYFYICKADADAPGTYKWEQINVQPKVDPTSIIDDTKAAADTTYSSNKVDSQIKDTAKNATYKAETSVGAGDGLTIAEAIEALEDESFLNYKGTTTAAITAPADGDLYYFNIAASGSDPAVIGWKFYSTTEAVWKDLNDATLATRVAALETQVGKDKTVTGYESKTNLVEIINVLTAADTENGSIKKLIKDAVKGLTGAMHFVGAATPAEGQSDVDAINALYVSPAVPVAGDFAVITTNGLEYVFDGTIWAKLGDELTYVPKSQTIAGIDQVDAITASELKAALDVDDLETAIGFDTASPAALIPVTTRIADEAKNATYKAADASTGAAKVTIAEAIKALEDHSTDTNGAVVYKGIQPSIPLTGAVGDTYSVAEKLYTCTTASTDSANAVYTEIAVDLAPITTEDIDKLFNTVSD